MMPAEPIAIVGAGCRFSGGASGTAKLWELLRDPIDVVQTVPSSRFDIHGFAHPDPQHHGTTNSTKSYFLEENHKLFDAGFFKVSPQEAEAMDPQVCFASPSAAVLLHAC